ncbi:PucR family transcriptional regulator [Arthrobacter sp. NPDC058127]|uniref:PucR family transcriptional regulator n=1 Tax=Arthrobacter sp. NPDC058127 TaxID=3346351 RepID=UPI0036EFC203
MVSALQNLVDSLGHTLQRSIAVDDAEIRLIVYSSHYGDEDRARTQSLVERRVTGRMLEYLTGHGIKSWREPKYMDGDETLGLKRRLVLPLWSRHQLLGYVWIIAETDLNPEEMAASIETSTHIADVLSQLAEHERQEERQRETLARSLVAEDIDSRDNASRKLNGLGLFTKTRYFTAVLIVPAQGSPSSPSQAEPFSRDEVNRVMAPRLRETYLFAPVSDGALVVLGSEKVLRQAAAEAMARDIQKQVSLLRGSEGGNAWVIGVGAPANGLGSVHISFRQAVAAAKTAKAEGLGVGVWSSLGPATLLAALHVEKLDVDIVPEELRRLSTAYSPETLRLVEVFLDTAGSAARTAEVLHMHRTTVYYQLGQFQQSSGLKLDDGSTRFLLHLWFKIQRLTTLWQ